MSGSTPLALEVRRRMAQAGLRQKSLALSAGLNETYVRDIIRGKSKNPKQEQLGKLANALGCRIEDLTGPGRASGDPNRGDKLDEFHHPLLGPISPTEVAVVQMWRRLLPLGRQRVMIILAQNAPEPPDA